MKHKFVWAALVFLLGFIALLVFQVKREPTVTPVAVDPLALILPSLDDAGYELIGSGIFRNETGGQIGKLTYWGNGEDFPSLGIGHFIWFPQGVDAPFDEQFPDMFAYVSANAGEKLPAPGWLKQLKPFDAPWASKQQFDDKWSSPEMAKLRQWLYATRQYQARFIVSAFQQRWQLLELPAEKKKQYTRLLQELIETPEGLFAVIDYYNFKGLGNNPRERYQEQGWGLLQVLQEMTGLKAVADACIDPIAQFRDAAASRLALRVELAPAQRNESRWLSGWMKRLGTYVKNESMARRITNCGFRVKPYLQNPSDNAVTLSWLGNQNRPALLKIWKQSSTEADGIIEFESSPILATALAYNPKEGCKQSYCSKPSSPYLHQIRVTDLQAGSTYQYEVELANERATGRFVTSGPATEKLRFIVYGDSETEPESTAKHSHWPGHDASTAKRQYLVDQTTGYAENLKVIKARDPAFVAIAGDLVESGGEQRDWDEFWLHNEDLAANSHILPALGNHDYFAGPGELGKYETEESERAVRKYQSYFDLPDNGSAQSHMSERYYSVNYGPVRLIVIDTIDGQPHRSAQDTNWRLRGENDGGFAPDWHAGSEQFAWLVNQLKSAQESSPFTFVMFHAAPYTSGVHGQIPGENDGEDILSSVPLKVLTPLFMRYGVDAVFNGHDEMYEHSVVSGREVDKDGVILEHEIHFLDVGIGGDGLRGPLESVLNPQRVFLAHVDAPEVYDQDGVLMSGGKHYGHLEVNIEMDATGRWKAIMDPVYIFPVTDAQGRVYGFERRLYDDSFELQTR